MSWVDKELSNWKNYLIIYIYNVICFNFFEWNEITFPNIILTGKWHVYKVKSIILSGLKIIAYQIMVRIECE